MLGEFRDYLGWMKKGKEMITGGSLDVGGIRFGFLGSEWFIAVIIIGILFYLIINHWQKTPRTVGV